jgi:hypothetical protein
MGSRGLTVRTTELLGLSKWINNFTLSSTFETITFLARPVVFPSEEEVVVEALSEFCVAVEVAVVLLAADTVTGEERGLKELPIVRQVAEDSVLLSNILPVKDKKRLYKQLKL